MPFMVIHRTSDGVSCHEQVGAIDEAALFVERLRNKEGIDQIRIYRMEEISFAFRPYYKVELGTPDRGRPTPPKDLIGVAGLDEADMELVEVPVGPSEDAAPALEASDERDDNVVGTSPPPPPPPPVRATVSATNGRNGLFGR